MEWAIECCKQSQLPVCASMCIGPEGDMHGVSASECAVRMAKAGADVIGVNCHFGPFATLKSLAIMKKAIDEAGMKVHLMAQPLAFVTPDAGKQGFIDLPEFPFGRDLFIIFYAFLSNNSDLQHGLDRWLRLKTLNTNRTS